jgi:catechol 2,3-dioxygenase-like lactoylglutathione lyase family enzyme
MINITDTNVTIMVKDMDAAIEFYQQIGLTLKQRWDDHYAMMITTGLTIGIHPAHGEQTSSGNVSIGFMIENFGEAKALLEKNNIPYKAEDDGKSGNYLHFTDKDGTLLYYVQPKW